MLRRETALLALLGFVIWLQGAVTFHFAGALLLEHGLPILALVGLVVAVSICVLLTTIMGWRKLPAAQSVTVAVVMLLPGLFGDVVYVLAFSRLTGLQPASVGAFAAVMLFGTAALLAFALVRAARS